MTQIEEWKVDVESGKSSDVIMRSVAALAKYAVRKQRQHLTVPDDSERLELSVFKWTKDCDLV